MFSSNTSAVSGDANYIEDVFSTYLYTGNATARSISNGVDLAGKGGMVWTKSRSNSAYNLVFDTARGAGKPIISNSTDAQYDTTDTQKTVTSFNADGFSLGTDAGNWGANFNAYTYASWTFRKQPKFFDVVTYTGNGTSGRTIAHSLGSVPGCIIVKNTSNTADWAVYHRSLGSTKYITLNATDPADTASSFWNNTDPTSTNFTVGSGGHQVNWNGETYVAYLFAHDAGGFGLTGTDNVISCGSFTTDGSGRATVELGYEPQWLMQKSTGTGRWEIEDVMRGWSRTSVAQLMPNLSNAEEVTDGAYFTPTATGFTTISAGLLLPSVTYIYIAIRRGPMKVPTDGTKVFAVDTDRNATKPGFTSNFPVDFATRLYRLGGANMRNGSRLTGANHLESNTTAAEASDSEMTWDYMTGWGNDTGATSSIVSHMFRRAPSFFDEVCTTADGSGNLSFTHNLGVAPDLVIMKARTGTFDWYVYCSQVTYPTKTYATLDTNYAFNYQPSYTYYAPTSTTFTTYTGGWAANNGAAVAYLFATCPGVSKVGSYTGTGTTKQVDCGFAAGARFVLIKRTDSSGDWYVWDTARGIVSGNDPYLLLNSTAAEVTSTDYIDTYSAGFELSSTAPAALNASGGTFIFLAIA